MKKGGINVGSDFLIIMIIGLVAMIVIIVGFSTNWGRGQDTVDDILDIDTSDDGLDEDGRWNPFGNNLIVPLTPALTKLFFTKKGL